MSRHTPLLLFTLLHVTVGGPLTPNVPYDWTDPKAPEYGWEPAMNGEFGYYYGNVTCTPDYDDMGVSGNYGNCHDPEIGGKNSRWKSCVHVWINKTSGVTDWRCMCHITMHARGNNCEWDWGLGAWLPNGLSFMSCALVFFIDGCFGVRLVYQMLKLKGFKMNAAITSCMFVTLALFSEAFRHSLYGPRNMPANSAFAIDGVQFDIGLFSLPVTIMCMCQGLLGLSITWIGIAEKSGNVKGAKKKLAFIKTSVWVFMAVIMTISLYMAAANMSSQMSSLGIALFFVLTPTLVVASSKLRKLLSNGAPPKEGQFDISKCLKQTSIKMIAVGPVFIGGLLIFMICDGNIRKKGPKERTNVTLVGLMMLGYGLWFMMHTIKNFFAESNAAALAKFERTQKSITTMYGKGSSATSTSSTSSTSESVSASKVVPEDANSEKAAPSA